jgi:flagellar hook protein FlgE
MSLFGSMFSGVLGLTAQSQAMAVISNNVANVNTTAYTRAGAEFSTLVTGATSAATSAPKPSRPRLDRPGEDVERMRDLLGRCCALR